MKILFLLLSTFLSLADDHDAAIAMFKIYEDNAETKLYVSIDANDLTKEIGFSVTEIDVEILHKYLKQNFSISLDENIVKYTIDEFQLEMDHFKIIASLNGMPKHFQNLQIFNTCLASVEGHSNIIQVDLDGKSKDFRMHKGRSKINIEY